MRHCFRDLLGLLTLLPAIGATVPDSTTLDAVSADVQQVCTQPATAGQHWAVTGTASGNVGLQIRSLAGTAGTLSFSNEEWSGIQRVLASDQAGDNDSYRRCVEQLTPLFLAKVPPALSRRSDLDRRLRGFLAANQLPAPGTTYGDAELSSQFGVRLLPSPVSLGYPVLNGSFRALSADINSPIGHSSRIFVEQDGSLVGVLIVQTCAANATIVCANSYSDWKASIGSIVGNMQETQQRLDFSLAGGPFSGGGGTLTKSISYDDPWRVYFDRLDPSNGGPTAITLIIASNRH